MRMHSSRGFTLIELLVVIAIIGLLSSVVLSAVGAARAKGIDAAVKSQLVHARTQAEYYSSLHSNQYTGVCAANQAGNGLFNILTSAATSTGTATVNTNTAVAGTYNTVTCHDSGSFWAAEAPLRLSASGAPLMWCVDSIGDSKQETSNLQTSGNTQYTCP